MHPCSSLQLFPVFVLLVAVATGCSGQDGPPRYRVSGEITHRGVPVPIGVVQFMPDGTQGNSGPTGFAEIKDGKFDTNASGKGVIGGPHIVSIDAYDGQNIHPDVRPNGNVIVAAYQKPVKLEADTETVLVLELSKR